MADKKKKEKKPKVKYIDDGSTIADMSNVGYGSHGRGARCSSSAKEKWQTYWEAVKMMFVPMLIVIGIIGLKMTAD